MPLFIDTAGSVTNAETDVFSIVRCDTGLGEQNVAADTSVYQVTYRKKNAGAGQNRIEALVGIAQPIVIEAVDSSYILPDGTPITATAGLTVPFDGTAIRSYYDVTQDAGAGYYVYDAGGNQISFPGPILLFHELAHAYHLAIGDSLPPGAAAEFQAEKDENSLRAEVGLTLRDPNNHGGAAGFTGAPMPSCGGTVGPIQCFVVTAALGSPEAEGVRRLQAARDWWSHASKLGELFVSDLMSEYQQFGPAVALAMFSRADLRDDIRTWFVDPLLRYQDFVDLFRNCEGDIPEFIAQIAPFVRIVDTLASSGVPPRAVRCASEWFCNFLRRPNLAVIDDEASASIPNVRLREAFKCVAAAIAHGVTSAPMTLWAAGALARFWRLAECYAEHTAPSIEAQLELSTEFEKWLSEAPIPKSFLSLRSELLTGELKWLSRNVMVNLRVKANIRQRLLEAASAEQLPDVQEALAQSNFSDPT
jgi:hypothetical protein